MVEGVVVEQPAAVRATTAGEIFGISEQTVSVPPGDVGLTFDWPLVVKEVAAGSPLFGRVQAGAALVAVDGVRATPFNIRDKKKRRAYWTQRRPRRSSSRPAGTSASRTWEVRASGLP